MNSEPVFERVPIGSIEAHPDNPRRGDVHHIRASLDHFGQYRPIVVHKSTRHILAGNHTWKAATELDWAEIDVMVVDCPDDEAKAIMLADNRLADLGEYDDRKLLDVINSLEVDSDILGYDMSALQDLEDVVAALEQTMDEPERGDLLDLLNVTIDDPDLIPEKGSAYRLGDKHMLVVAEVMTEWDAWKPWLLPGKTFLPYPGPLAVLSLKARDKELVLVQPDPYIAGHILQHWHDAGFESAQVE